MVRIWGEEEGEKSTAPTRKLVGLGGELRAQSRARRRYWRSDMLVRLSVAKVHVPTKCECPGEFDACDNDAALGL